jgi:hypothetical protein
LARTRPQQRIRHLLAIVGAVLLFAAGFALASTDLSVGIEGLFVGTDSATILYTANEPADFTCQLGDAVSPCGTKTTQGAITYPVTPGTYTFSVIAQNTAVNKEEHSIDTYVQTATTAFSVTAATAPPPPPVSPPPPPPPPALTHPDLAIAILGHRQGTQAARASVEVTNRGDAAAPATTAHLRVTGTSSRPHRVPALEPGHHYRLRLVLTVPPSIRGHERKLFAVVAPVAGETAVLNNIAGQPATFPGVPPVPNGGTPWRPFAGGAAALLLLAGAAWFLLRGRIPASERLDWQLRASDGELPRQCSVGQRICKREGEFEPAPRELLELSCAHEAASGPELTIRGEAVRRLSQAHAAYARNRPADAQPLVAGAEALVWEQVSSWLGHGGRGGVHLDAKFEGSSASCTFKLFRCARVDKPSLFSRARHLLGLDRDDEGPWHELAHWKAEVKDATTVEVGTLEEALVWDQTRQADLDATLRAQLGRLAERWVKGT